MSKVQENEGENKWADDWEQDEYDGERRKSEKLRKFRCVCVCVCVLKIIIFLATQEREIDLRWQAAQRRKAEWKRQMVDN